MVTITAVIINRDVWIKYTITFSAGTLITHIIKVYLVSVFQHGSSCPVRDSSQTIVFLYLENTILINRIVIEYRKKEYFDDDLTLSKSAFKPFQLDCINAFCICLNTVIFYFFQLSALIRKELDLNFQFA